MPEQKNKLELLSPLSESYMSCDDWYQFTTFDNYWVRWRFEALAGLISRDYIWGTTLDIGCGAGVAGKQIMDYYGCQVDGCDLNLKALNVAADNLSRAYFYNIRQRIERFKDGFSTVLLLDVLEHIKDPVSFLDSVGFHLKPAGRLIINVPAIPFLYGKYDLQAGHVKRYGLSDIKKELDLAGFRIEKRAYWGFCLAPLAVLRKLIVVFFQKDGVIKAGFQPSSRFVGAILQLLRRLERAVFTNPPIGTSLLVVAQKK